MEPIVYKKFQLLRSGDKRSMIKKVFGNTDLTNACLLPEKAMAMNVHLELIYEWLQYQN